MVDVTMVEEPVSQRYNGWSKKRVAVLYPHCFTRTSFERLSALLYARNNEKSRVFCRNKMDSETERA